MSYESKAGDNDLLTIFESIEAEDYTVALERLDNSLRAKATDANAHYLRAFVLDQLGRESDAQAGYQNALLLDSNHAEALHHYGVFLAERGELDAGIALLQRSLANEDDSSAWYDLGVASKEAGLQEQAVEAYRNALRVNPNKASARENLSVALYEMHRYDEALAECVVLEAQMPLSADFHIHKADTLLALGKRADALDNYRIAIGLNPGDAYAFHRIGVTLDELEDYEGAVSAYRDAIRRDMEGNDAWINMGIALDWLGRYDEAQAAFHQALVINPNDAGAYQNLGASLHLQGRTDDALAAFETAMELAPNDEGVLLAYASSLWDVGRVAEATPLFEAVLARDPQNDIALDYLIEER